MNIDQIIEHIRQEDAEMTPLDIGNYLRENVPKAGSKDKEKYVQQLLQFLPGSERAIRWNLMYALERCIPSLETQTARLASYQRTLALAAEEEEFWVREFAQRGLLTAPISLTLPAKDVFREDVEKYLKQFTEQAAQYQTRWGNLSALQQREQKARGTYLSRLKNVKQQHAAELQQQEQREQHLQDMIARFDLDHKMTYRRAARIFEHEEEKLTPEIRGKIESIKGVQEKTLYARERIERQIHEAVEPEYRTLTLCEQRLQDLKKALEMRKYMQTLLKGF